MANPASRSEHYPLPKGGVSGPCRHGRCPEHCVTSPCCCRGGEGMGEAHGSTRSSPGFAQAVCSGNFCSSVWPERRESCLTAPPQCCTKVLVCCKGLLLAPLLQAGGAPSSWLSSFLPGGLLKGGFSLPSPLSPCRFPAAPQLLSLHPHPPAPSAGQMKLSAAPAGRGSAGRC